MSIGVSENATSPSPSNDVTQTPTAPCSASDSTMESPSPFSKGKIGLDAIIILAISAVVCYCNHLLMADFIIPPSSNDAMHLAFLASFNCAMSHADSIWEAIVIPWIWPCFYPSGSYLITYFYSLFFGNGILPAYASLMVMIPVLLAAVYYIVRPTCGFAAAIVAVLATASVPQGLLCCVHYPSDLQVGLGASLTMCMLFHCDVFRRRRMSILFGIAFGYSLMFKSNVAWFIAPALAVLLLSRWRDWIHAPLTVLWHLTLFVGAFVVCLSCNSNYDAILTDIARCSSYTAPAVQKMLLLVTVTCIAWWVLSMVHWGKLRSVPMLTNLSQSLAVTFFISMPWILSNLYLVGGQRLVFWDQLQRYSNLDTVHHITENIGTTSFGVFFLVMTGLSLLFSITKWANAYDRALALTAGFSFIVTACCLGPAGRYFFPCYVISACCLATPLRKSKIVAVTAIIAGLCGTTYAIWLPVHNYENTIAFRQLRDTFHGYFDIRRAQYRQVFPSETVFVHTWELCPALSNASQPRWISMRQDTKRIKRPAQDGCEFRFDPIEDAYNAVITWSSWHDGLLVPFLFNDSDYGYRGDRYSFLPLLYASKEQFPGFANSIHAYINDNSADATAHRQGMLRTCPHFFDIETADAKALSEAEIAKIMECPHPAHNALQTRAYTIHVWSRPEAAPSPSAFVCRDNDLPLRLTR